MEIISLIIFGTLCFIAAFYSRLLTFVLLLIMFPLEQALQSFSPYLKTGFGLEVVNYSIGLVVLICVLISLIKTNDFLLGYFNRSMLVCCVLYAWSVLTLVWSPGQVEGLRQILSGIPYFVLIIIMGSLLITSISDLYQSITITLIISIPIALVFIFNNQFEMTSGRLVLKLDGVMSSNVLATGEFGGFLIIFSSLFRSSNSSNITLFLRITAGILGSIVAIQSGSRGQLIFSIIISLCMLPVTSKVKNLFGFISLIIGLIFILSLSYIIFNNFLEGKSSDRFSLDQLLYGQSSASGRLSNILNLAGTWAASPFGIFLGLGYGAFSFISASSEVYSHVLFADAIFELGIPGFLSISLCLIFSMRSLIKTFQIYKDTINNRSAVAILIALIFYQFILVNKQGYLWGIPYLFLFTCVAGRIESRLILDPEQSLTLES